MHDLSVPAPALARRAVIGYRDDGRPTMARLFARLLMRLVAVVRAYARRAEQRHRAAAIRRELGGLDSVELHDLGIDVSEIDSVAAEMTGGADITRARVAQSRASVGP
jgi:hypothetical protein